MSEAKLSGPAGLELDCDRRVATVDGVVVEFGRREFNLLEVLLENPGRVISFEELAERAWGHQSAGDPRFIYTATWRLRRALAEAGAPNIIQGKRGVGYSIGLPKKDARTLAAIAVVDPTDPALPVLMSNAALADLTRSDSEGETDAPARQQLCTGESEHCEELSEAAAQALQDGRAGLLGVRWSRANGDTAIVNLRFSRLDEPDGAPRLLAELSWVPA